MAKEKLLDTSPVADAERFKYLVTIITYNSVQFNNLIKSCMTIDDFRRAIDNARYSIPNIS